MNTPVQNPAPGLQTSEPNSPAPALTVLPPAPPLEKPRADSRLKTLPEDRQFDIAEYSRDHSLCETIDMLNANGVPTSKSALSRFLVWYRLREQKTQNDVVAQELLAQAAQQHPDLTPARLQEIGHLFFAGLALANQDAKAWFLAQRIALSKARFDFAVEQYQDQKPKVRDPDAPGGLTPETIRKIEAELHLR